MDNCVIYQNILIIVPPALDMSILQCNSLLS